MKITKWLVYLLLLSVFVGGTSGCANDDEDTTTGTVTLSGAGS